ncbi:hypothetical protein B0181_00285 [Moraxella caviae]|uniref:Uncharacterized protein n=1 Tax=Moraxella caviae TaxID=34060 RepID=A0A1T0ACL9_9GAMM|nr:hypothetical protein [Moraxella caviae]OOR93418.1 hypothetical protein B0181_00285 [Moraxella caviae]STZ14075.1 Uncharacterised protein [Moraxella caviae]VEW11146.1 Uncharacterised protein [Moraxella caviae]
MKTPINQAINDLQTQTQAGFVEVGNQLRALNGRIDNQDTDNKIAQAIATLKTEILGGATSAFDTLKELEDAINSGGTASALADAVNKRVRFDEVMTLTDEQIGNVLNTLKIEYSSVNFASLL